MLQAFSQEVTAEKKSTDQKNNPADTREATTVIIGKNRIVFEDDDESLRIKIGNRGLTILESLEGDNQRFEFKKIDEEVSLFDEDESLLHKDYYDDNKERERRRRHFSGHWSGVEFGFNNYLTSENTMSLPSEIDFMSLHSGKSSNFNINFTQLSIGLTRRIGFVTGLGLNWNNYRFNGNNNIRKGSTGIVEILEPAGLLKKSKLTTLYLTIPFLAEIQIPANSDYLNISAGPVGSVKITSFSKMVFEDGDKIKSDDDFNLSMLRYGVTARLGYENFNVYGTYYITPMFNKGKAPGGIDLYPFEIGLAFTFNN